MTKKMEVTFENAGESDRRKRFEYLMKQAKLYIHFTINDTKKITRKSVDSMVTHRHRRTEREEDTELLALIRQNKECLRFEHTPFYIKNGKMHSFQVHGLNWLISIHENGINGILADDMCMGKTLQVISFLGYLKHFKNQASHHLIVVPKSIVEHWINEFKKWCPSIQTTCLLGDKVYRRKFIKNVLNRGEWDVCVTTYEMLVTEKDALKKFDWHYMIIDDAHRIKYEKFKLSEIVRKFKIHYRLVMSCMPLSDNLNELWEVTNFLLPDVFNTSEDFDDWFNTNTSLENKEIIVRLHILLQPFLIRRLRTQVEIALLPKTEVKIFVGLSKMQHEWYTNILKKDVDTINDSNVVDKRHLQNIFTQLRKCTNHPYLFNGAESGPPYTTDMHLVSNSGKMVILDKLLQKLEQHGSRVLIFSQMLRMLDILEDYCIWRCYNYCRLDGRTSNLDRVRQIDEFNKNGSNKFIFLLTTRAGGLGINLSTADSVIIYDSDCNPQMDLQAIDRAHRIGQQKQVRIYRFITESTIEEKLVERAEIQLRLDKAVIKRGRNISQLAHEPMHTDELLSLIQFGSEDLSECMVTNLDIDNILARGIIRTVDEQERLDRLVTGAKSLRALTVAESTDQFEEEDYCLKTSVSKYSKTLSKYSTALPKRVCKVNDVKAKTPPKPKLSSPPQPPIIYDFQFYPLRLLELMEKEINHRNNRKTTDCKTTTRLRKKAALTPDENAEKKLLLMQTFTTWTRSDFDNFIKGSEKYGRYDFENISKLIENKTIDEVREYGTVFWERFHELQDKEQILERIQNGEEKLYKRLQMKELLDKKVSTYRRPFKDLQIKYEPTAKFKEYTDAEDRFLVCMLHKLCYFETDNLYKDLSIAIQESRKYTNWFLKSRPIADLEQRCNDLVKLIENEQKELSMKGWKLVRVRKLVKRKRKISSVSKEEGNVKNMQKKK